jgi:tol-pal system protein YbgF
MHHRLLASLLCISIALTATAGSWAADDTSRMSVEDRLARLERLLDSQGLVDIMLRLESLQAEVQKLRGASEEQAHALEELKKRQRDLYIDIDRRLLQLERNASAGSPAPTAAATAGTVAVKPAPAARPGGAATTPAPAPVAPEASEQEAYQNAFNLLRELRYDKATRAFRDFLQRFPDGRYAHIAQYWLAEGYYAQGKYRQAITAYQGLIDKYPTSPKLAEAMLKIGYSQYELKDYAAAEASLQRLLQAYPGTTEAGQAQNLLQKIRLKRGK